MALFCALFDPSPACFDIFDQFEFIDAFEDLRVRVSSWAAEAKGLLPRPDAKAEAIAFLAPGEAIEADCPKSCSSSLFKDPALPPTAPPPAIALQAALRLPNVDGERGSSLVAVACLEGLRVLPFETVRVGTSPIVATLPRALSLFGDRRSDDGELRVLPLLPTVRLRAGTSPTVATLPRAPLPEGSRPPLTLLGELGGADECL